MGIIDFISNIKKQAFSTDLFGFNGADENINTAKLPVFPEWFFTARIGQPRNIDFLELRQFSKSPWIQMVLNTIKREVSIIDHDVINKDLVNQIHQKSPPMDYVEAPLPCAPVA